MIAASIWPEHGEGFSAWITRLCLGRGEPALRLVGDMQRLELRPGDIVILRTQAAISFEAARKLKEHMEAAVPGHKVIVLGDGLEMGVIRPAESDEG